jgi:hypothetical protein
MKLYLTIAESLGTDAEFTSEVYPATSAQDAGEMCSSLIADMIETMDLDRNIDPTATWELEGDGWWFRVRWEEHDFPTPANPRAYAVDIVWDTDGEDEDDLGLPSRVEIPFFEDDDEIADYLSDKYGYCVFGFNIEQI